MNNGAYHTAIFKREEAQGLHETMVVRKDGHVQSLSSNRPGLTTSFGDILSAAFKK